MRTEEGPRHANRGPSNETAAAERTIRGDRSRSPRQRRGVDGPCTFGLGRSELRGEIRRLLFEVESPWLLWEISERFVSPRLAMKRGVGR